MHIHYHYLTLSGTKEHLHWVIKFREVHCKMCVE